MTTNMKKMVEVFTPGSIKLYEKRFLENFLKKLEDKNYLKQATYDFDLVFNFLEYLCGYEHLYNREFYLPPFLYLKDNFRYLF